MNAAARHTGDAAPAKVSGKHRKARRRRQTQPYAWLGAGAMSLGVGAALATGSGLAHADTGPGAGDRSSSSPGGDTSAKDAHSGRQASKPRVAAPSTQTVTVQYATSNGTATAGLDYISVSGTISFAPGETHKIITVPVKADSLAEASETFTLLLSNPTGTTITDGSGTRTILNRNVA